MSTPSVTMPTRMYSSGVFIRSLFPLLQEFTGLGEANERDKRDNGHKNDNQIKHIDPPRETAGPQYSPHLQSSLQYFQSQYFCALPPLPPGAAGLLSDTVWAGRPGDEIQRAGVGSRARQTAPRPATSGLLPPHRAAQRVPRAEPSAEHPSLSDPASKCPGR